MTDEQAREILDELLRSADYYIEYRNPIGNSEYGPWQRFNATYNGYTGMSAYQKRIENPASEDTQYQLVVVPKRIEIVLKQWFGKE